MDEFLRAEKLGPYREHGGMATRGNAGEYSQATNANDGINWNLEFKKEQTKITRVKREALEEELVSKKLFRQLLLLQAGQLRSLPEELQRRLGGQAGEQAFELSSERIEASYQDILKAVEAAERFDVSSALSDDQGTVPRSKRGRPRKTPPDDA